MSVRTIVGSICRDTDCFEPARRDGYCWGHYKRRQRGGVVSGALKRRPLTSWERLSESALSYADATDMEDEFERASDRLRKAAKFYRDGDIHCDCCARKKRHARRPRPPVMRHRTQLELF